jgi:hypothetical protein
MESKAIACMRLDAFTWIGKEIPEVRMTSGGTCAAVLGAVCSLLMAATLDFRDNGDDGH